MLFLIKDGDLLRVEHSELGTTTKLISRAGFPGFPGWAALVSAVSVPRVHVVLEFLAIVSTKSKK